jgi:AraC family transcriptional regulator, regulatory protein of adaptative response / methylated-DNA-[protein]-cysteine methyltransferase
MRVTYWALNSPGLGDGYLWYSVETTGVYCRPSCPSRTTNPKSVQLHDSLESARAIGFRPCKRCNPEGLSADAENAALVAKVCRMIEECEEEPSLEELAEAVGRSPSYFHRIFKATTGVTPKEHATAHRAAKVRHGLTCGSTVTEAIYDAGFNSSERFYEKSTDMLGMTPSQPVRTVAGRAPRTISPSRSLATAWFATTARSPVMLQRKRALIDREATQSA